MAERLLLDALLNGSEAEAFAKLREMREDYQSNLRTQVAERVEAIRAEARRVREVLALVRMDPKARCEHLVAMRRHWRLSKNEHYLAFQRAIRERYPNDFDWDAHLDELTEKVCNAERHSLWEASEPTRSRGLHNFIMEKEASQ